MSLQTDIKEQIKTAMKAKEHDRLETLRALSAAFTNELVATKRTPHDELGDDEAIKVVQRLVKQHKDSIEQYKAAGRDDLADEEKVELIILKEFTPQMMERDEIMKLAIAKRKEMNVTDPSKKGMLIGALMKDLAGKADGGDVKDAVEESFNE